jgi:outer membrane protein assembly factor BamB
MAGKLVWQQNLQSLYGEDTLWWDLGTSPVLTKNHVVVAVMHSGPSYVAAFDKATGKQGWKQDRNLGAPSEAAQSYSTPVVLEHAGRELIVVLGADHVTAHDAVTGIELWRVGGLNPTGHQYFRSIASPVIVDDIVVAPYGRGATIVGIRLGGSGDVTKSHVAWTKADVGTDVPTPAASNGQVYVLRDKGDILCINAKTGETVWTGQTEKNRLAFSASPVMAGGNLYVTREDGKTFVIGQGKEFKVVANNDLDGEFVAATPVFADGQILIRTIEHLYCIGQ